ncbi:acyl-CoA dehydrogenase family protein [Flexivirga caeni]|nr:acyl-CoA dehydrogenase family protein [Flexivirga caeni]
MRVHGPAHIGEPPHGRTAWHRERVGSCATACSYLPLLGGSLLMDTDPNAASCATNFLDALTAPLVARGELEKVAWKIGAEIAGPVADEVDAQARFPVETVDALRQSGLLAALVPAELGGKGATLLEVAGAVRAVAMHCTSSALILGMHSIEVFNLVRHGTTPGLRKLLEEVATGRMLLANANSEVGLGGDVTRSRCALEPGTGGGHLEKEALAVSYGEYADGIVTIARRSPDAADTDQIMMVCRAENLTLECTSEWNTMGLRGTCSSGFRLSATIADEDIFPVPFATISNDGAAQARQILLCAAWVGLAEAAAAKAHAFVRAAARRSIGALPPSALRLSELAIDVQAARCQLLGVALQYAELDRAGYGEDAGLMVALRSLKVSTSELAVSTATSALQICGMAGFRRTTPFALDRIIRDAHGGLVMVSNERLLGDNAGLLAVRKTL